MPIAVAARTENPNIRTFTLWLCPTWQDGACHCERDEQGQPTPGHTAAHFPIDPPAESGQSPEDWQAWTAQYAIELVRVSRGEAAA